MAGEDAPRVALTTGANSGIGLHLAIELARRGFRSVGSVRSPAKADVVEKAAAEGGVEVDTVLLDVTDAERSAEVIDEVRPWALINNAGYMAYGAVEETDDASARRLLETLVVAPMRLARLALPHMRAQQGGRIVQVSSVAGRMTFPLMGWYQGAKHAFEAVSDALRIEVARDGIAVIIAEPGGFKTALTDELSGFDYADDSRYARAYETAQHRLSQMQVLWGDAERAAAAIAGAVTTRFPRPRYVIGHDARLNLLTKPFTPTVVRDFAYRRLMGL